MINRELYLSKIRPFYDSELVKVITGIRRCGKSTVMQQIIRELQASGVTNTDILYINFEDYQYKNLCNPDLFYEYIKNWFTGSGKKYFLFDEIQNVTEFELVINSFRATTDASIFLTGSNSRLLSGELATHLTGRTVQFRIMPFNFKEYVEFQKFLGYEKPHEDMFADYIRWGGFPLVCKEQNEEVKKVILSNIYDSIVLKDVIMRNKIASPRALEKILEYVIANSSTTISGNTIASVLSDKVLKISAPTVYDYLKYISDACICDIVPRFDIRGKKILAFSEKTYVCDTGLFYLKKNRVKDEYNYIIETICYNELISRGYSVYVGKTYKGEVDFIAQREDEKIYIQVAYLLADESTVEREFGAFDVIQDHYPKYVISTDRITLSRNGIIHINLIDWLIGF
ncbi:MAG: ATPase [Spirochaetes bacterium GWF1_31_7]|nr:MAG: ATPase [Spirochaetes bacterium GWE1_32_154]OHD49146.1 MAG: ATPase [Spirochaetes bacterium GWF1_31_7]OHD50269.1 MAG: ATPase [Spirochaetes bacterium GWE2_31_10]OHD76593.1 MAG: ATPase [Spirochaetes bacterium RIFOXYB1_FULL_32_8]HBD93947.1 ATPase [Spirochaetia bacterium]